MAREYSVEEKFRPDSVPWGTGVSTMDEWAMDAMDRVDEVDVGEACTTRPENAVRGSTVSVSRMDQGNDRLIQGMAAGGNFRIIAAQTTHTVETARIRFDLSPVAADALGRALTGSVLLARLLEKTIRDQRVSLRFDGGGPLGVVVAEGSIRGSMRGYVGEPQLGGTLDVGEAVGMNGTLTVMRGAPPSGNPYSSQIELASGEIATDLAHYLAQSEQIASAVLLGVMNRSTGVASAGGMIIQAFPHATDEEIAAMEEKVRQAPPFSTLLAKMPIEGVVAEVLRGMDYKAIDPSFDVPLGYRCSCSRDRALAPLSFLEPTELEEMIAEGGSEVTCHYCNERYDFTADELRTLRVSGKEN